MSYEIELKAHVKETELEKVKDSILGMPDVKDLGEASKFDMYWSETEDGNPLFRTRREKTADGSFVLFTAKPSKSRTENGTEENQELEFTAPASQWDDILTFCSGLGLQVCRLKWKKGPGYIVNVDGFQVHVELLEVKYLGWFLEMEICVQSLEGFDKAAADSALRSILKDVGISEEAVECRGYNKMLKEIGHDRG